MKKSILYIALGLVLISTGCNREHAEEAVQGYLSKSLNDLKDQLPDEIKMIDSLLGDTVSIKEKIAKTTNIDSLEKYKKQLLETKNLLKEDLSKLDSINPEILEMLDINL